MRKIQLPVIGGIRKVIEVSPSTGGGTTIAEIGNNTVTLEQLAALIFNLLTNTGTIDTAANAPGVLVPGAGLGGGGVLTGSIPIYLTAPIPWFDAGDGGADGDPGPPGQAGIAGVNGATGGVGPMGPAVFLEADSGYDGDIGPPGLPGLNGATGGVGPIGPAVYIFAEDGTEGDMGPPGPAGTGGVGGGGSITISDGTNTITSVTKLTISGAALLGSASAAIAAVNINAETHPVTSFVANDEFETGATIDTAGTRFSGATAWAALNTATLATISNIVGGGSLRLASGTAAFANLSIKGYVQNMALTTGTYQTKILPSLYGANGDFSEAGLVFYETGSNKAVTFSVAFFGSTYELAMLNWTNTTSEAGTVSAAVTLPTSFEEIFGSQRYLAKPIFLQAVIATNSAVFNYSYTGVANSWVKVGTMTTTTTYFTTGPNQVGLYIDPYTLSSPTNYPIWAFFDHFRQTA